jgi:hypothetical protein
VALSQIVHGFERFQVGHPAGRVGGRIDEDGPRAGLAGGLFDRRHVERETTIDEGHGDLAHMRLAQAGGGDDVRPGRRRNDDRIARIERDLKGDLDALHARAGDEEALRHQAPGRSAAACNRQWPARKLRQAALPGVEGLALGKACGGRLSNEVRRR